MPTSSQSLKGLYVITDDTLTPINTLNQNVEKALRGGAKIIQLRDKMSDDKTIAKTAIMLQRLCEEFGALFVLNDKIDLAVKYNFQGLHIGRSDHHKFDEIRANFKGILGVSCYGDVDMALDFERRGADYVAFGSFFTSLTKPLAGVVELSVLDNAKAKLGIPVCAIGGINSQNVQQLIDKKVDMVAVISDIWKSDDIQEHCKLFSDKYIN